MQPMSFLAGDERLESMGCVALKDIHGKTSVLASQSSLFPPQKI